MADRKNINTPQWIKKAVFYQIFPDRFFKSNNYQYYGEFESWDSQPTSLGIKGGNLSGILEKLDYLKKLGVNALYLTPIFQSASNHRYHTFDYFRIDPVLGTNNLFKDFLNQAHKQGFKVVIDGVFNHCGRGLFQFHSILENGSQSPYKDWFKIHSYPLKAYESKTTPNYDAWWNLPALPKFNTANPEVREFLFSVGEYWIRQGTDGWRLDVPSEIDDDVFWREFRSRIKRINPEAYIVGEIWENAQRWLKGDQFDAVMNYEAGSLGLQFICGDSSEGICYGGKKLRKLTAEDFGENLQNYLAKYPEEITSVQLNLTGSHDTQRLLTLAGDDREKTVLMFLFLFCLPGAPCIFYGDEQGLTGGYDPECRKAFPTELFSERPYLFKKFKDLASLRKKSTPFRIGKVQIEYCGPEIFVLRKTWKQNSIFCIFSLKESEREIGLKIKKDFKIIFQSGNTEIIKIESSRGFFIKGKGSLIIL